MSDVVITGIGLVSCLGEGVEAHRAGLNAGLPVTDAARFSPYTIHPAPEIDWNLQIPKRGDQRQMEMWQRLGTYSAGLALADAGIKDNEPLCATMDMIVAAGGGERDVAVDAQIFEAAMHRADREVMINEKLTTDLRPTLFLAQLSNLLAGNISIVHKVTGSSRTFMGEESAGISAIETAAARIQSGQSTHVLVGGAYQTEHPDMLYVYESGRFLHRGPWAPVWERKGVEGGGVITGTGGAFIVLESASHAAERGARAYAKLAAVKSGRARRPSADLSSIISGMAASAGYQPGDLIISGASGAHEATAAEALAFSADGSLRAFCSLTGHMKETQFPFAVALAALAVDAGQAWPPIGKHEKPLAGPVNRALVSSVGFHRGEGFALLEKAEGRA